MRPRSIICSLALSVSLVFSVLPGAIHAASPEPRNETPVVVAEDKTVEADCKVWVDSPANERPCEPGSVIFARHTTYGEVKKAGITDYAVLTGDAEEDRRLQDLLVSKVSQRIKERKTNSVQTMANCWWHWKTIGGSYLSIPSDPNSTRMFYQVSYQVWDDCIITGVSDQSRTSGPVMNWLQSCSRGTAECVGRNGMAVNGNWTAWQPMLDTAVGAEYRHLSASPCWYCGMPYGINTFVQ